HGRAAFGAATRCSNQRRRVLLLREIGKDIDRLLREKRSHAIAPAKMLSAGIAFMQGKRSEAFAQLEQARAAYDEAAMRTHSLTVRWDIGTVRRNGAEIDAVEHELRGRGVYAPARWARMHLGLAEDGPA